jgi:hypothetical protein
MRQLHDPKFARAIVYFKLAFLARQRLQEECARSRNLYGVAGSVISGGFYPHWHEDIKRRIRRLNRMCNRLDDAGMRARPARVQLATMRTLRGQVGINMIRYQHGSIAK